MYIIGVFTYNHCANTFFNNFLFVNIIKVIILIKRGLPVREDMLIILEHLVSLTVIHKCVSSVVGYKLQSLLPCYQP